MIEYYSCGTRCGCLLIRSWHSGEIFFFFGFNSCKVNASHLAAVGLEETRRFDMASAAVVLAGVLALS